MTARPGSPGVGEFGLGDPYVECAAIGMGAAVDANAGDAP